MPEKRRRLPASAQRLEAAATLGATWREGHALKVRPKGDKFIS